MPPFHVKNCRYASMHGLQSYCARIRIFRGHARMPEFIMAQPRDFSCVTIKGSSETRKITLIILLEDNIMIACLLCYGTVAPHIEVQSTTLQRHCLQDHECTSFLPFKPDSWLAVAAARHKYFAERGIMSLNTKTKWLCYRGR